MAKINPVKLKQDADKLEKAGKLEQAIALYRQIVEDSPRDWNTINKVGDLLAKLNKFQEANEEYAKVADFYAKDGFHLKAIAIWKKINKLDPSALGPYVNLAELYAKQGLMMEAKGQYQIVVEEYIKRGKMKDAGEVLRKMAEIDPADLKVRSKLADLYTREGQHARAVEEHVAIADELSKKGHLTEAVQVLEKGLKIDARSVRLRVELGRVHIVQKNFERAAAALEEAARLSPNDQQVQARLGEACLGAGRIAEAEALYRGLLERNAEDVEARAQMGRVYLAQRRFDQALDEFAPLVERHVARREGDAAAALLQEIVQREATHVKTLVKLAEVYRLLKQDSSVVATYSQLTEAYLHAGQHAQAIGVLETLVSMEPYNEQHKTKLQFVRDKRGAAGSFTPAPMPAVSSDIEEEFDLGMASDEDFPGLGGAPPAPARRPIAASAPTPLSVPVVAAARPRIELSGTLSDQEREFVDEHMAEGKVFRKYGLIDKAADQFEAVVARFPDQADARQELRDIYKEKGQLARAAEHARALAEIARLRGDTAGSERHERDARELQPAAEAPPAAPAPVAAPAKPSTQAPPTAAPATQEIPLLLDDETEEEITLGVESEVDADGEDLPEHFLDEEAEEATARPAPAATAVPATGEIDVELAFAVGEDEPAPEHPAPSPAEDVLSFDEPAPPEDEAAFEFPFDEEEPAPPVASAPPPAPTPTRSAAPAPPPAPTPIPSPAPAPPPPQAALARPSAPPTRVAPPPQAAAASSVPADVQRVLAEVEEYVALGFVDDARDALSELAQRHPDEPLVRSKMAELGLDASTPGAAPEFELPPADDDDRPTRPEIDDASPVSDLAEMLGDDRAVEPALDAESLLGEELSSPAAQPAFADELEFPDLGSGPATPAFDLDVEVEVEVAPPLSGEPAPESIEDMLAGIDDGPTTVPGASVEAMLAEPALLPVPSVEPALEAALFDEPAFDPQPPFEEPELDLPALDLTPAESESPLFGLETTSAASSDGGLDLGAELFGAISAINAPEPAAPAEMGDASLADIFREFKKGVDRQLGQEDYDTRYNLGIAYKEMGLVDEAIAEFQLAAKDPGRLLECSSMLGICFLDKGMPKLAVKWFEKGLQAPGRSDEEYQGLRYDLACAYESDGDAERARGLFAELFGQDAGFRDVAEKLRALSGR